MSEKEQNETLDSWLASYRNMIFKVVRSYAFTAMDREDLFQDIAIQVWRSIPGFRGESAVSTWIYRISLNTAMRFSQKERKINQGRSDIDHLHDRLLQENDTWMDERLAWLYDEISKLDHIDKPIALLLLEGFSYKEMAAIIGITESNIGVRINRIKKHLTARSKKSEHYGI